MIHKSTEIPLELQVKEEKFALIYTKIRKITRKKYQKLER